MIVRKETLKVHFLASVFSPPSIIHTAKLEPHKEAPVGGWSQLRMEQSIKLAWAVLTPGQRGDGTMLSVSSKFEIMY